MVFVSKESFSSIFVEDVVPDAVVAPLRAERSRRLEARGTLVGADLGGRMALDLENDDADATVRSDGDAAAALAELLGAARSAA